MRLRQPCSGRECRTLEQGEGGQGSRQGLGAALFARESIESGKKRRPALPLDVMRQKSRGQAHDRTVASLDAAQQYPGPQPRPFEHVGCSKHLGDASERLGPQIGNLHLQAVEQMRPTAVRPVGENPPDAAAWTGFEGAFERPQGPGLRGEKARETGVVAEPELRKGVIYPLVERLGLSLQKVPQ